MALTNLLAFFTATFFVTMTTMASQQCTKFETYNTGLINAVPNVATRRNLIIDALKLSSSDFICLQEVWFERDLKNLINGLKSVFPHHFSALHVSKDVVKPASRGLLKTKSCRATDTIQLIGALFFCGLIQGCLNKSGYPLGVCLSTKCNSYLKSPTIKEECVSCVFLNAFNSLGDAIKECSIPKLVDNRLNGPGLLVFSKKDMLDVSYTRFIPDNRVVFQRGYIAAKLSNGITAVCSHFSSNIAFIEYDLDIKSYKQQQVMEIKTLDVNFGNEDIVLLGDLNMGPRVTGDPDPEKNLDGEFTDNYDLILSLGFTSPYQNQDGHCTYCDDNPLIKDYPNQILDHVMVKGQAFTTSGATRLYHGMNPVLSDHFGVGVKVCTS